MLVNNFHNLKKIPLALLPCSRVFSCLCSTLASPQASFLVMKELHLYFCEFYGVVGFKDWNKGSKGDPQQ